MLIRSWRKLLSDLEDDLQGFSDKEQVWNSWHGVCYEKFWKHQQRDIEGRVQSDACEVVSFQHMTDRHYQCCHETDR
jgi:hypothetical protein